MPAAAVSTRIFIPTARKSNHADQRCAMYCGLLYPRAAAIWCAATSLMRAFGACWHARVRDDGLGVPVDMGCRTRIHALRCDDAADGAGAAAEAPYSFKVDGARILFEIARSMCNPACCAASWSDVKNHPRRSRFGLLIEHHHPRVSRNVPMGGSANRDRLGQASNWVLLTRSLRDLACGRGPRRLRRRVRRRGAPAMRVRVDLPAAPQIGFLGRGGRAWTFKEYRWGRLAPRRSVGRVHRAAAQRIEFGTPHFQPTQAVRLRTTCRHHAPNALHHESRPIAARANTRAAISRTVCRIVRLPGRRNEVR